MTEDIRILQAGKRLEIQAGVEGEAGVRRLQALLDKYAEILKLLEPEASSHDHPRG